jgi:glycerol-3-phosphate acyltransferase PlsY
MTDALAAIAIGYLLGSLPFGYWAGRLRGIDLRLAGSGNTGATNVMRVLGLKVGVPVMALDIAKGAVAVVVARALSSNDVVPVLAAAAAVTGHMYPILLGFRGGKGVATGAGTMIALVPWIGIAAFFLWLGLSLATRYVSIGSVVTAIAYPTTCIASGQPWAVCLYTLGAGAWVIWRHRANIARLRAGTENRINLRAVFAGRAS